MAEARIWGESCRDTGDSACSCCSCYGGGLRLATWPCHLHEHMLSKEAHGPRSLNLMVQSAYIYAFPEY